MKASLGCCLLSLGIILSVSVRLGQAQRLPICSSTELEALGTCAENIFSQTDDFCSSRQKASDYYSDIVECSKSCKSIGDIVNTQEICKISEILFRGGCKFFHFNLSCQSLPDGGLCNKTEEDAIEACVTELREPTNCNDTALAYSNFKQCVREGCNSLIDVVDSVPFCAINEVALDQMCTGDVNLECRPHELPGILCNSSELIRASICGTDFLNDIIPFNIDDGEDFQINCSVDISRKYLDLKECTSQACSSLTKAVNSTCSVTEDAFSAFCPNSNINFECGESITDGCDALEVGKCLSPLKRLLIGDYQCSERKKADTINRIRDAIACATDSCDNKTLTEEESCKVTELLYNKFCPDSSFSCGNDTDSEYQNSISDPDEKDLNKIIGVGGASLFLFLGLTVAAFIYVKNIKVKRTQEITTSKPSMNL